MNTWWMRMIGAKVAIGLVALVSVGGVAAAAAEVGSDPAPAPATEPTTTSTTEPVDTDPVTEPTTEPSTDPVTDPTVDPTDPAVPDDDAPDADPAACVTHGQKVSEVAHATPRGPGHGAAVSAAAHDHEGECGRDDEAVEPTPAPTPDAGDEPEVPEPDEPDDDDADHRGNGSHGGGHGKAGKGD